MVKETKPEGSLSDKRKEYYKQLKADIIRAYNENTNPITEINAFIEVMTDLDRESVKKLKEALSYGCVHCLDGKERIDKIFGTCLTEQKELSKK